MADPNAAADENPFDQFNSDAAPGASPKANPFDQFNSDQVAAKEPQTSATGAFTRSAVRGAFPAIGSLPAIGTGAEIGAELGTLGGPLAPVTVPIGGLVGGGIGAFGGSYLLGKVQDWALSKLPDSWKETLGLDDRQEKLDQGEHPVASFLGGIAPYAVTMRPGAVPKAALPENATALQRILAHPATARLFGGAAMGGMELGQEAAEGGDLDWRKGAIATGFGLIFNRPTRIGEALTEMGARPVRTALGKSSPTVAQAADAKVMGPGVTENVFQGAHEQDPAAESTAQAQARAEQATIGEAPTPDVHAMARQMHPELFAHYDDLVARQEALRSWVGEQGEEAAPAAVQHLATVDTDVQKLAPEIAAAYRRAAEATGAPTLPVGEKRFATMAEMLAAQGEEDAPAQPGAPAEAAPPKPIAEQRATIAADAERQFVNAGEPQERAELLGKLTAERYVQVAQRFNGALGTAEEIYRREGPAIKGAAAPGTPAAGGTAPQAPGGALARVDNTHDVVSGANSSKVPNGPVYIDKRIPELSPALKDKSGQPVNLHKYLAVHEDAEATAMREGLSYDRAHIRATEAERAAVEADGVDWNAYTKEIDGYLSHIENEKPANPPPETHVPPEEAIGHHHAENKPPLEEALTKASTKRGPASRDPNTFSLLEFLAANGGIRNDEALVSDLKQSFGGGNKFLPGFGQLIRNPAALSTAAAAGGRKAPMTLDKAREAAVEAGYLAEAGREGGVEETNVGTLLDAIDREARGDKLYRQGYQPEGRPAEEGEIEKARHDFMAGLDDYVKENGGTPLSEREVARAFELWNKEGIHAASEILERLALEADDKEIEGGGPVRNEPVPGWDIAHEPAGAPGEGERIAQGESGEPGGGAARTGGERAGEEERELEYFQRRRPAAPSLVEQREAEGQLGLPGTERIGQGELAQRKANEPLKPAVEQKPMDVGLFGTEKDQKELFQTPVYYSMVARTVENAKQEKASPEQWLGPRTERTYTQKDQKTGQEKQVTEIKYGGLIGALPGVKPEEIEWLGLPEWLKSQERPGANRPPIVTKQEILDYIRANSLQVQEVAHGNALPLEERERLADEHSDAVNLAREAHEAFANAPARTPQSERQRLADRSNALWDRATELGNKLDKNVSDAPVKFGPPNYAGQGAPLPGGENYRELLLTLPNRATGEMRAAGSKAADMARALREKYGERYLTEAPKEELAAYERVYQEAAGEGKQNALYKSAHWEEPNVLAHIRFDDRVTDGKKTLHVAEIQSDWHQAGRKKGYQEPPREELTGKWRVAQKNPDGSIVPYEFETKEEAEAWAPRVREAGREATVEPATRTVTSPHGAVPDAPFKTSWAELSLKRMIRYAAENGYERLSWDTGETNAERYDLSKRISRVAYVNETLSAWDHSNNQVISRSDVKPEQLPDYIGKEATDKLLATQPKPVPHLANVFPDEITIGQDEHQYIATNKDGREVKIGKDTVSSEEAAREYAARYLNQKANEINLARVNKYGRIGPTHELSGVDLKVGGEGMRGFYDQILPTAANKLVKKFGARVQEGELDTKTARTGWPNEVPDDVRDALRSLGNLGFDRAGQALSALRADLREGKDIRQAWDLNQPQDAEAVKTVENYLAESSRREPVHTLDITPQLREAAISQGFPLFQGAQGKVRIREGAKPVITLFESRDASTAIHELGHVWLEEMMRHSEHEAAPETLKTDAQTIKDWLGVENSDAIKTRHHEKFAKGFEQYLREGVAPSPELGNVFARFRDWMLRIYQSIKGLGEEITPAIREVFDRMLAMEPQRTVIAPDLAKRPSLQDIHEADARDTEPHEAEPAMDRTLAERDRFVAEAPPEIANEIAAEAQKIAAAEGTAGPAEPAGEGGPGAGGLGEVVADRGLAGPEPAGGAVREERGPVEPGGGHARGEGAAAPAGERPESGAGLGDKPLAPRPSTLLGAGESPFLDRAGNIRLENLTNVEDVRQAIRAAADENKDFIADRRGVVTDGQVMDLAADLGLEGAERLVKERVVGQAFNAEQVIALRKLLVHSATELSAAMKKAAEGTDEDVIAYAVAKDRHQMIQATVAQATAEAGRALRAFRNIAGEGNAEAAQADLFVRQATGKTLYQLRQEAKLGAALDTPQKISKFMQDAEKKTFGRMILEYWINGLISGPATHATYMIGNEVLALEKAGPETAAAAAIGALRRAMGREGETVRLGEVAEQLKAHVVAVPSAVKAALDAFRTGVTTALPGERETNLLPFQPGTEFAEPALLDEAAKFSDAMQSVYAIGRGIKDGIIAGGELAKAAGVEPPNVGLRYSHLGALPDVEIRGLNVLPLGTAVRLPSRFIAAIHSFFRSINYSMEKNALAYRDAANRGLTGNDFDQHVANLRQNPTEAMMTAARGEATELTLMGQGGEFTKALSRLTNTPVFGLPIFKFIDPFVHISSNIIQKSIIERTPVGVLSPEIRADLMGRNGTIAQDTAMARMLVGTAYAVGIGSLAASGYVSGSGPSDPKQAAVWRLAGNQAHSVRVGDIWYDVHRLGPLGMLMGVAADLYDVAHQAEQGDMLNAASHLQHAVTQNVLDESFMRGPSDLIKAVEDPGRYGESYIRNFLSSFLPYSVGMAQMARASDPYSRQARSVMDAIKAKVPGLSETLLPRRDIWGEPMANRDALLAAGVTAIYETRMSRDPVNLALLDLGIAPAQVTRKIRNVQLTDDQYDDFQRIAGRMAKMRLDAIVNSPDYRSWPNHVRHDVISEVITQSREAARGIMMAKFPQIVRDATQARLKKITGEPQ